MGMKTEATPIVPMIQGLWEETREGLQLSGSRCRECGELFFPRREINFCSHCHEPALETAVFGKSGKVIAFTNVERKPAGGFYKGPVPYTYGIVELNEGIQIYTQYVANEHLDIGAVVELVVEPLYEEDSQQFLTFKYCPVKPTEGGSRNDQ